MSTSPEQAGGKPAPNPKPAPKAEPEKKEALAKVSKITSRGRDYTQLWLPREIGEKLTKGALYTVQVERSVITATPAKAAKQ